MLSEYFCCPEDKSELTENQGSLDCGSCGRSYQIEDGIPVFSEKRGYWSNVPQDSMRRVIELSEDSGSWRQVLRDEMPEYERHISPLFRGDIHVALPLSRESVVLDAGSMWGGITLPLARYCKSIYAVDQTWESLRYLDVRARQDAINNIVPAESSIAKLPFKDKTFDLIILNGVLEWLATEEEVVLERDWENASTNREKYEDSENPELMQLAGLKELNRTLKEDGAIYIAIENRIGLQYLVGYPDDHVNIRFVSFLPRFLADFVTRKIKNHAYRTYLYSPNKLKELVKKSGFEHVELYSAHPHYNIISRLTSFTDFDQLAQLPVDGSAPLDFSGKTKVALFSAFWGLVPNPLRKHLAPSIAIIAGKSASPVPRMVSIFSDQNIISHNNYSVILANNRFSDETPTNFLLRNRETAELELFCKVSRDGRPHSLAYESTKLKRLNSSLKNTEIECSIPQLRYAGNLQEMELQACEYEYLVPGEPKMASGLMRVLKGANSGFGWKSFVKKCAEYRWFSRTTPTVESALSWLAEFNGHTMENKLANSAELVSLLREQVVKLDAEKRIAANDFLKCLSGVDIGTLGTSVEHGDFDLCNVFRKKKDQSIFIVDFEHAEENCLPFFDIGNILFSTLVREWKDGDRNGSLSDCAASKGWKKMISLSLRRYSQVSGVSLELLKFLPSLAVIRQFTKDFPDSRDPNDYPLYDDRVFAEMISWRLEL